MECVDCKHYNPKDSYTGTGYCQLWGEYTTEFSTCEDGEEE